MDDVTSIKKPYFSIIIPCYNCEAYVESAINSIVNQSFKSLEVIAVNDGSTDSTADILKKYSLDDDRIRVFNKDNGGYCSAVNFGLDNVRGKYFMFMGSDDSLFDGLFDRLYNEIKSSEPDMVGFRTIKYRNGQNVGQDSFTAFDSSAYEKDIDIKGFQHKYAKQARILSVRDTSKIFKAELLGDLRYFGKYGFDADGIFAMLFTHKCNSFMCVPVDGYKWTLRGDSLSGKVVSKEVYEDRLSDWMLFYDILKREGKHWRITNNEIDYVDYYYDTAWKYARTLTKKDLKTLTIHTRNIFCIMRRYKVTVGETFKEKIVNYYRLLFPKSAVKILKRS